MTTGGTRTRGRMTVINPYDGTPVGTAAVADADAVGGACERAGAAFAVGSFPRHHRVEALHRMADGVMGCADDLAGTIAAEAGKPLRDARTEVRRTADTLRISAAVATTLTGELLPLNATASGAGRLSFAQRVPRGVVAAISPFNFPLNLVAHKVGPALAVGCPIVVKPAERTPLTALRLAGLAYAAGVPQDWLQIVCGPATTGEALVSHPVPTVVTFTGSGPVGQRIARDAVGKRVLLELGSNAVALVAADADLGLAARRIAFGGYGYAGQSCVSTQRVLVDSRVHDHLIDLLRRRGEELVVGDPLDPATDVGPLIDPAATERVSRWVQEAQEAGARLVTGGGRRGPCLAPALLIDVPAEVAVWRREVFGPVLAVRAFTSLDIAIAEANDTNLRLHAGVFTTDLDTALTCASRLDFGGVNVNDAPTYRADGQPYGGVSESGNTREGPAYAAREFTELKTVTIRTDDGGMP